MARAHHWQRTYVDADPTRLGWYQPEPARSLAMIGTAAPPPASVVDVGGGASFLADRLLASGYADVTVLDLSDAALAHVRARCGEAVATVCDDVRTWRPGRHFDVWHDRAVFHFLTEAHDRAAYAATLRAVLPAGGHAVIATFSLDGRDHCSGLPVVRYSPESLLEALGGDDLVLVEHGAEVHHTPSGVAQPYQFTLLRRR